MDSPCIKQTVCKVLKIFQYGKYLVAYVLMVRGFSVDKVVWDVSVDCVLTGWFGVF